MMFQKYFNKNNLLQYLCHYNSMYNKLIQEGKLVQRGKVSCRAIINYLAPKRLLLLSFWTIGAVPGAVNFHKAG
jgi:hypothetical protein